MRKLIFIEIPPVPEEEFNQFGLQEIFYQRGILGCLSIFYQPHLYPGVRGCFGGSRNIAADLAALF